MAPPLVATLFLSLGAVSSTAQPIPAFDAAFVAYAVAQPAAIATADLNEDGRLDLVVTSFAHDTVGVLLNEGPATFAPPLEVPTGQQPRAVATGDVNGDGHADAITVNGTAGDFRVFLGDGTGRLIAFNTVATDANANVVALADLNADGHLDVLSRRDQGMAVGVWLGDGTGQFAPSIALSVPSTVTWIGVTDLNMDGNLDVVALTTRPTRAATWLGDGHLGFAPWTSAIVGGQVSAAVGDVTGDGIVDLISCGPLQGRIFVWPGDGAGAMGPPVVFVTDLPVTDVVTVDVTGDARLDVVATGPGAAPVLVNGGLGLSEGPRVTTGGFGERAIAADLNGDGAIDLALIGPSAVAIHVGHGDGTFGSHPQTGGTPTGAIDVQCADLNSDGESDVVVAGGRTSTDDYTGAVSVFLGESGRLGPRTEFPGGDDLTDVRVADVTGDGLLDALVVTNAGVVMARGDGAGTFAPPVGPYGASGALAVSDLNADGVSDLVSTNRHDSLSPLLVSWGHGDGTFSSPLWVDTQSNSVATVVGDMNRDGRPDVLAGNASGFYPRTISVHFGTGAAAFLPAQHWPVLDVATLALGDLDGDGALDVVAGRGGTIAVLPGHGDGTLGQELVLSTPYRARDETVGDVNADGVPDLVTANPSEGTVSVLLGTGDGRFLRRLDYGVGGTPWSVALADINHDARLDIVVGDFESGLTLLRSIATTTPVALQDFSVTSDGAAVELRWQLAPSAWADLVAVTVERTSSILAPFTTIASITNVAQHGGFTDRVVEPNHRYWYRVVLHSGSHTIASQAHEVLVPQIGANASLQQPVQTPTGVLISYTVYSTTTARLAMFDVRGRRLWASSAQRCSRGEYSTIAPVKPPHGVYWVHGDFGSMHSTRKWVLGARGSRKRP